MQFYPTSQEQCVLLLDVHMSSSMLSTYGPYIGVFKHCKPLIQIDGIYLYEKYKGTLFVAITKDDNKNILSIAFTIIEGETVDAWYFFLHNLQDGVGLIFYQHELI